MTAGNEPRTVLITGSSRGIGRATALLFAERGWNVVATMRNVEDAGKLNELSNLAVVRLDVEDDASVRGGVAAGLAAFGGIDVVVNNAGYGVFGALEAIPPESMARLFEVNVFGMLRVARAVLPHFRQRGGGLLVQMSSIAGKVPFPLGSVYNASKFAVEGMTEALSFELGAIGARVKMIEPGVIDTDALGSSLVVHEDRSLEEYQAIHASLMAAFSASASMASAPSLVAERIWQAVNDGSDRLRYPVGPDAEIVLSRRRETADEEFLAWLSGIYSL
jgi:NAD(P)-dependent dehydrogenase (short-subunit alcohol dehydrogenase family)